MRGGATRVVATAASTTTAKTGRENGAYGKPQLRDHHGYLSTGNHGNANAQRVPAAHRESSQTAAGELSEQGRCQQQCGQSDQAAEPSALILTRRPIPTRKNGTRSSVAP